MTIFRKKYRKCLRCKQKFISEWIGNRICEKCAEYNKPILDIEYPVHLPFFRKKADKSN